MSWRDTMEFAWEGWKPRFKRHLVGLDSLSRQVFYDLQQDRIPNDMIRQFLTERFAELVREVADEEEQKYGRYRYAYADHPRRAANDERVNQRKQA